MLTITPWDLQMLVKRDAVHATWLRVESDLRENLAHLLLALSFLRAAVD